MKNDNKQLIIERYNRNSQLIENSVSIRRSTHPASGYWRMLNFKSSETAPLKPEPRNILQNHPIFTVYDYDFRHQKMIVAFAT